MRTSGIPQLSREILFVDHEDIDTASSEFREELGPSHAGGVGGASHGDPALLIPVDGRGQTHLVGNLVRCLTQGRKQAVRNWDVYVGHRETLTTVRSILYGARDVHNMNRRTTTRSETFTMVVRRPHQVFAQNGPRRFGAAESGLCTSLEAMPVSYALREFVPSFAGFSAATSD